MRILRLLGCGVVAYITLSLVVTTVRLDLELSWSNELQGMVDHDMEVIAAQKKLISELL